MPTTQQPDPTSLVNNVHATQQESNKSAEILKTSRQNAIDDARSRGYTNNTQDPKNENWDKSSYNPVNWSQEKNDKVVAAQADYIGRCETEQSARNSLSDWSSKNSNDPNYNNMVLQAGMTPQEIDKNLYLTSNEKKQSELIKQKTEDVQKSYQDQINKNNIEIKNNTEKIDSNSKRISELQFVLNKDPENESAKNEIKQLQNKNDELQNKNESLTTNNKELDTKKQNAPTEVKDYYGPNNVLKTNQEIDNTVKLSDTGFENINNGKPFYMQMPTIKAITDFRLRNGYSPYGERSNDEIARDAVHFKIFEHVPGVASAQKVQGTNLIRNVIDQSTVNTLGSFTIYPSNSDWLNQSHSHNFNGNSDDFLASTFNTIGGLIESGERLTSVASAGLDAIKNGSLKGSTLAGNSYQRRAEVLKFYQNSNDLTLTVEFNLFTKKDFLNDVFRPIMFLTALGYPKRSLNGDLGNNIKNISQQLKNSDFLKQHPDLKKLDEDMGITDKMARGGDLINSIENYAGSFGGLGPYRYYISKRPEYLSVRHASGLFFFPLANITNFNYTFKGPWYNYDGVQLTDGGKDLDGLISEKIKNFRPDPNAPFLDRVGSIFKNFGNEVAETFSSSKKNNSKRVSGVDSNSLLSLSDMPTDQSGSRQKDIFGTNYAYPTWATCQLTIQSSLPFFRDDFMQLYNASGTSPEDLVKVTQKNNGDESFFGNQKSRDNQIM